MPWDMQSEIINFSFLAAGVKEYCPKALRLEIEKFPLAYWVQSPGSAVNTYNLGWEYSLDGSSWVTLDEIAIVQNGSIQNGIVDLSKVSNKPSGAKFLRCYVYPTNNMGGADSAQAIEVLYAGWVEDIENSSGMRAV